jgi:hypothetical protein
VNKDNEKIISEGKICGECKYFRKSPGLCIPALGLNWGECSFRYVGQTVDYDKSACKHYDR